MRRALLAGIVALALATPAVAQPPVWVVRDADSEMLLFGSIHVLPPGLEWRPAVLDAAVAQADDLWFELPMGVDAEQRISALAARLGVLAPGKSLLAMLPKADAARLMRLADHYGVDMSVLDRFEPWLAEVALAAGAYNKVGASGENGVERVLDAAAPESTLRAALETPDEQLGIFDSSAPKDQLASLRRSLVDLEADPDGYLKLVRAWQAGDLETLIAEAITPLRKASPTLFRRLVTERNARWTRLLDARLRGRGRSVVVVGAGHLIGEDGVPARLRALGYSVTGP